MQHSHMLILAVIQGLQGKFSNSHDKILGVENLRICPTPPYLLPFLHFLTIKVLQKTAFTVTLSLATARLRVTVKSDGVE